MVNALRHILQYLYPYGTFTLPSPPRSKEGGGEKFVYLTFDDGPIPEVTPKVLEILARYNVKATFFMVGENIDKHPDTFARVVGAGHSIGNHTYNHLKGIRYSRSEYLANVEKCRETMERHLKAAYPLAGQSSAGSQANALMRPPYGKAWIWQRRALHRLGYRLIYWDVLTRDYDPARSPEDMFELIKRRTCPGSVINFHDSLKSNGRMLAVLPRAIEWLLSQGYSLRPL